ncbi:exonuclease 1 [Drosophila nasuta]|uniref:exonuclease 1 n=1 Tax=Drosophila nasuta TaxID=42062 RepID=UPI00295F394D|nr:exonuclease 1 [Drosophila nasuta]
MGITGLIPFLEKASAKVHLKSLRGSTVAVDTYCWLHKGVFGCAEKLARGEETDIYIQYCLKYVQMLLSYDIKPILVFDGQHLPAKALTEQRRRESRQQSKKRAAELLRLGRTEEARSQMRRCVDVTHEMALRLIQECRERHVDCIVAPYEADAQMAWLNKTGIAQYIVTEDSDLTLFGAQKIIFKLDLTGAGLLVEADKIHLAMGCREERYNFDKFRRMCIMSGCDYLDSLPGIGLAKACKFMLKTEQDDMRIALKKIPQYLNMRQLEVDDEYIENFMKAEATFKHMYIYNPLERRMERLCALEDYKTDESYCSNAGSLLSDSEVAFNLALGNLNPFTLKRLDSWHPDHSAATKKPAKQVKRSTHKSIWQKNFNAKQSPAKLKQSSCALFFKKVDFVTQTIAAEIEANQRQELAKPTEAELSSMYSLGVKRKRSPSESSCHSTPPSSPAQSRSRHNPFAKEAPQRSPVVCENGSLLRLLSPNKQSPQRASDERSSRPDTTRVNALKRSIFAKEQVEVRSRFFSTQTDKAIECKAMEEVEQTPKQTGTQAIKRMECKVENVEQSPNLTSTQVTKRMECKVEKPLEEVQQSPKKTSIQATNKMECKVEKPLEEVQQSPKESKPAVVVLSSCDSDDSSSLSATLPSSQEAAMPTKTKTPPKLPPSARRVGLSRPKTSKRSIPNAKTAKSDDNQTKLSMFGFQKRPVLK